MATASPFLSQPGAPDGFAEALNGLIVGVVGLEFARRALAAALDQDDGAGAAQALIDEAYQEGRLGAEDYEALTADVDRYLGEDVPTEWSQDLVDESAPGSDTLSPGEAPGGSATGAQPGLYPGAVLLGRFVLQARLGATGTSDIFKALDRRRQQAHAEDPWVALKLAVPGTPRYEDSLRMLRHEAELARRLEHPHIVRVFDFDQDDGHAFLTMEWLDGESLADLLTRQRYRPLTVAHARQVATEIADALEFAHGRGITHADVKPGNIFLARDGNTKLLDFGTARSSADAPHAADARTPAYASCEVLEGEAPLPQDDLYSLACVVYRMLAGRRAFGHHDALTAEKSGRRPAPVRGLPPAQWAALARALAFRRADRTPDMATFIAEFNAAPPAAAPTYRAAPPVEPAAATAPPASVAPAPRGAPAGIAPVLVGVAGVAAIVVGLALWPARQEVPAPGEPVATRPPAQPAPPDEARAEPPATPAAPPAARVAAAPAPEAPPAATRPSTPVAPRTGDARARRKRDAVKPAADAPPEAAPTRVPATMQSGSADPPAASIPSAGDGAATPEPAPAVAEARTDSRAAASPAADAGAGSPADAGPPEVALSDLNLKRYVRPAEPRAHRGRQSPAGWVEIAFVVGTDGAPRDLRVTGARPAGVYDEVALDAVRRWRFEPAMEEGRAVERRTAVRLRFQPEE